MDYKDRIEYFKEELSLIINPAIKNFVKECLKEAPDYVFEDCPSSSSGRFHPISELSSDGTLLHSRRIFAVAYDLCRALDCEDQRDEVLASCLLHDMMKQGKEKGSGHTVREHPQLAADELVARVYKEKFKDFLDREVALRIYYNVAHHYGLWTKRETRKPLKDYTMSELCVFLSDYISSKRFIHIDTKRD